MGRDGAGSRRARWDGWLVALALVGIIGMLLAPPRGLLDKADYVAYAVCHRIPERTFIFAGRPLPLCARCSGTYLGALAGLIVLILRGRGRAADLPDRRYLAVFAGFFLLWAVDGLNSYLTLFPGFPHLYEPHHILRLATGTLEGLAIAAILLPILNLSLWARPVNTPSVASWRDLAWMVVGGAVVVGLVSSEWAPLLYPLALTSGATIVALVGSVNVMFGLVLLRREGRAQHWRETIVPMAIGVVLALAELAAIAAARAALTARLELPF